MLLFTLLEVMASNQRVSPNRRGEASRLNDVLQWGFVNLKQQLRAWLGAKERSLEGAEEEKVGQRCVGLAL